MDLPHSNLINDVRRHYLIVVTKPARVITMVIATELIGRLLQRSAFPRPADRNAAGVVLPLG